MRNRIGFFGLIITAVVLIAATYLLVRYAQGYRLTLDRNNLFTKDSIKLTPTGLLVATSEPDGASVYINNHLTSASNTTIDLAPGEYTVRIVKEGYLPWEKKMKVQKEVVAQTQALLFPSAPRLESITTTGVLNPTPDPTGGSIAFGVASASAVRKNGVFILDMNTRPILTLRSASLQIADNTLDQLGTGQFSWSPNARELLVHTTKSKAIYRLISGEFNPSPQDITATLATTLSQWQKENEEKEKARLESLKPVLGEFINKHFKVVAWSYDETKMLYEASDSAKLPAFIDPPLLGGNTQKEEREIKPGKLYVYDIKEDKNFSLWETNQKSPKPLWLFDNRHFVFVEDKQIKIVEYDGANKTVVYAGPFEGNFVYPWPDGSRLVILASLNPQAGMAPNLYTINLK